MASNILYIYCDGGCRGNQSKNNIGGWGVYMVYNKHTKELSGGTKNTSNQKMELISCINALKNVKKRNIPIVVVSDSQYVVKGITEWVHNWKLHNWHNTQGKSVANKELWQELFALKETFRDISFRHCKVHGNTEGNIKADRLANHGMDEIAQGVQIYG